MAETDEPKVDRAGGDYQRGPNPKPGGEIDTGNSAVPPYDERSTGAEDRPGTARAFDTEKPAAEPVSPGSDVTPDDAGTPPPGVGESTTRRGEDVIKQEGKKRGARTPEALTPPADSQSVNPGDGTPPQSTTKRPIETRRASVMRLKFAS
ncbi:hypothetical protein V3C33_09285 [Micrococcaceae bacterium Sec5.7]